VEEFPSEKRTLEIPPHFCTVPSAEMERNKTADSLKPQNSAFKSEALFNANLVLILMVKVLFMENVKWTLIV